MLKDLHVAHLMGTTTTQENRFFWHELKSNRIRPIIGQMFFKPYESKEEFKFCVRHTLQPILLIGLGILDPISVVIVPLIYVAASLGCLLISSMKKCMGDEESASWWLNIADDIFSRLCQSVINLVVLPITALVLVTRSASTGLKAADIYDYDAPKDDIAQAGLV